MAEGVRGELQLPNSGENGKRQGPLASPPQPPQPPRVIFHMTGFGVFHGIPDNPTTHLVRSLPAELRARGFRSESVSVDEIHSSAGLAAGLRSTDMGFEVHSHVILDVSAQKGGRQLRTMHARLNGSKRVGVHGAAAVRCDGFPAERSLHDNIINASGEADAIDNEENPKERTEIKGADSAAGHNDCVGGSGNGEERLEDDENGEIIVLVHCGVDGGSKTFKLETRGYNEATFRVPDEQGYCPTKVPIDESSPDISHVRETTLPISEVLDRLHEMGWGDDFVQESTSAGRFVCNYVYYTSLGLCEKASAEAAFQKNYGASVAPGQHRRHCLFLHVPPFSEIPKDQQLEFVIDCLAVIAKCLVATAGPSRTDAASIAAAATDMFTFGPATTSSPSTTASHNNRTGSPYPITVSPCQRSVTPRAPPAPPGRLARSSSLPYSGTSRRSSPQFPADRNHATSPTSSIWDDYEGSDPPREHRGSLMLPLPLLTADQDLKHSRSRSAESAASRHRDIDGDFYRGYSHPSHDFHDEAEQETAAELTRRRLIEAGFEMLDVDAAMATTGSDDMEINMQLLLDIGPLLPRGSPTIGDIDALRVFLSSTSDHVGGCGRGVGGGSAPAPRPSSGGKRVRAKSVGSAAGMADVSRRWKADITPRVVPGNGNPSPTVSSDTGTPRGRRGLLNRVVPGNSNPSPAVSSDTSTPRGRGGLFNMLVPGNGNPSAAVSSDAGTPRGRGGLFNNIRRHKKDSIRTGSSGSSTGTSAASSPPGARKEFGAHERVAGERERSTRNKPITAVPQLLSSTTTRARGESPLYSRRTTANSHCQSPSTSQFQVVGNLPTVSPSAGWGDTSLVCSTLRLVLLVRLDAGMGPGAIAAQCCRAALSAARKAEGSGRADALAVWRDAGEETVVLAARDARALSAILEVRLVRSRLWSNRGTC